MANTDNTNRNLEPRETLATRKCTYKEFMSCKPFYFNGTEGAVGLIRWFKQTESIFSRSNCIKDCKVKFATGTLSEDALSWWNSYAKPIGIEQADKIARSELKRFLTNKYCPRTEVKKMEDEFYKGLPKNIEGNVTASKPQTLEEAINITQRLMDRVTKHNSVQGTIDHKRKFDDSRNTDNNNYPNNRNNNNHFNNRNNNNYQDNCNNYNRNNDYHQQHNRSQEIIRTYAATSTKNKRYTQNKGTMETFLCVQDAPCITQDFALSSVRLAIK
nr:hypothetical protein [Tanacetum cinerariifolium]